MGNDITAVLKQLNLKVTPKRLALLEILTQESGYMSPEELWGKMKEKFGKIGLPTVYRNLEELSERDVISKVTLPNRQLYYFLCKNTSHHHHFVCLSCRTVEDIDFCAISELQKEVQRKLSGKIISHILQVNGYCRNCLGKIEGQNEI